MKGRLHTTDDGIVLPTHHLTRFYVTGSAPRTSTPKPTACAAGCELAMHNGKLLGVTASVFWRPATAAFRTQIGFAATEPRCFPTEPAFDQGRQRFVVVWGDQREYIYG